MYNIYLLYFFLWTKAQIVEENHNISYITYFHKDVDSWSIIIMVNRNTFLRNEEDFNQNCLILTFAEMSQRTEELESRSGNLHRSRKREPSHKKNVTHYRKFFLQNIFKVSLTASVEYIRVEVAV